MRNVFLADQHLVLKTNMTLCGYLFRTFCSITARIGVAFFHQREWFRCRVCVDVDFCTECFQVGPSIASYGHVPSHECCKIVYVNRREHSERDPSWPSNFSSRPDLNSGGPLSTTLDIIFLCVSNLVTWHFKLFPNRARTDPGGPWDPGPP